MNTRSLPLAWPLLILGLLFSAASCTQKPVAQLPTYRIGYMICNNEEETLARFQPLTTYLSTKLGVKFEALAIDTVNFTKEIESVDFTHTNSLLSIMLNRYHGVETLAGDKRGRLLGHSKGMVVTLKKSGITTIADLKGKTMIFGPMFAPTAFMSQIYALQKQGFDIDNDLAFYTIPTGSFKHEKVIYGLTLGKFDAAAFPYYDYEIMVEQGKINPEDYLVLAEGPAIPYCNFGVTQKVDEKLAQQFKKTLLAISESDMVEMENGERIRILERAQVDGFIDINDKDFDIVREMAKATNMPPYQEQ